MTAREARVAAGYTLREAARWVGRSPRYLAALESTNSFPFHLARWLSRRYACPIDAFLPHNRGGPPQDRPGGKWDPPGRSR